MDCSAGEQDPADMVKGEADPAAGRGVGGGKQYTHLD